MDEPRTPLSAGQAPFAYLLFARSELITGSEGYLVADQLAKHRWQRMFLPVSSDPGSAPESEGSRDFPYEVGHCVRLAVEIAHSAGVPLRVIDIATAAADPELVDRWVTPETILPLLVSPRGETLEGPSSFVPAEVREFFQRR
jgi:hypothetical protein